MEEVPSCWSFTIIKADFAGHLQDFSTGLNGRGQLFCLCKNEAKFITVTDGAVSQRPVEKNTFNIIILSSTAKEKTNA